VTQTVTALLVSHDGARWLPAVLDGLAEQTRAPDRLVAVDTGSEDGSADLLRERLGAEVVHGLDPRTPYGTAVAWALEATPRSGSSDDGSDEWVWLLHDDSAPAPDALERLLEAAGSGGSVDVVGPKLREWPSLRRLLEIGVTISGTGRRETGLERGEYDQGQHDRVRDVLAVNTAGMLVRRSLLERLGLDPALPMFGNDLDFGWRAARAGARTIVAPDAVVFHVEAAHRGVRRRPVTGPRVRRHERRSALYTLLVNGSAAALPFQLVRLLLGSLVRAIGLVLVRAPGEAWDELVALGSVYARPDRVLAGRRRRRRTSTVSAREVRHLRAPFWVPYRHGLDFVTDLGVAVAHQATDMSAARRTSRAARATPSETGPVPDEAQNLPADTGLLTRLVSSPAAVMMTVLLLVALWSARDLVGAGMLSGGALLPAPDGATDWWRRYLSEVHDVGIGSVAPAAPYLLPLALTATVLLGKAWLAVDVLMLLAVPLAGYGGYRLLVRLTGSVPAAVWGGAGYGLLPVLTGAVQQGRLGTVAVSVLLPWLVGSAVHLAPGGSPDRRHRAVWRTSLWLALAAAFAPVLLVLATAVAVVVVALGLAVGGPLWRRASAWSPVLAPPLVALVLLLPWSLVSWQEDWGAAWLTEPGLTAPGLLGTLSWTEMVFGRPGGEGAGAPWWLGLGVVLAAAVALARRDTRRRVLGAWVVVVVSLATAAALSAVTVALPWESVEHRVWVGVPLLVAQGAAVCAAALAGAGVRSRLTGTSFGWRQPLGVAVVAFALLSPLAGTAWWAWAGSGDPVDRGPAHRIPSYMVDAAVSDPEQGILVVRGGPRRGFDYVLLHGAGLRLGDESVLPSTDRQQQLTDVVTGLVTAPQPEHVARLAGDGVGFVYAPPPADPGLTGNLDSVSGLTQGSATRPGARAWQVQADPEGGTPAVEPPGLRPWLLAGQGLAVLVAAVLAAPTRRRDR
jgi:GT2 family glycosyltransferase